MTKHYKVDQLNLDGSLDKTLEVVNPDYLEKWYPDIHREFIINSQASTVYQTYGGIPNIRVRKLEGGESL